MSTNEESTDISGRSKIFSSQEFMEFLAKQAGDISKLEVTTKSGDRISASFNGAVPTTENDSVFKSLDVMKSLFKSEDSLKPPAAGSLTSILSPEVPVAANFTSRDWSLDFAKSHVDVTYDKCFVASPKESKSVLSTPALPPKKRAGKTDWNAMYSDALSPLVEAASLAQPEPEAKPLAAKSNDQLTPSKATVTTKATESSSRRKPRKVIPDKKEYVDHYTDQDVLFGRGGRSNHHIGNKLYREMVTEKQPYYKSCDKNEKTAVAQSIVDAIHIGRKGRFLELCRDTGKYFIVPNIMARRKVGQALRENNTDESRAAKREKYGQGKSKKRASVVSPTESPMVDEGVPTAVL